MNKVDDTLRKIAHCISTNSYEEVETERIECKNLAGGWGEDFYRTVCAFLNTNGGIVIIGIHDKNNSKNNSPKQYKFTGYTNSDSNEKHLTDELPKKFADREGKPLPVDDCINVEIRDFLTGKVAIVYVQALSDEKKYAFIKGNAYKRQLTGDHLLSAKEIESYEEIKKEIIQHQELALVADTSLEDANLELINNFIHSHFNRNKKRGETLKKNLRDAEAFLYTQRFFREGQLTTLGALFCGANPERFLYGKCKSDCYVVYPKAHKVADDKEIIEDNITALIERSFNFVWRNIRVGIAYTNGGSALPEYPESLLRESINNAFAHRDYSSTRPVIIEIRPQDSLQIRNPGQFGRRQRIYEDTAHGQIRRIIPLQIARNPHLNTLLQNYDYWEGKGRGLTSLIDACLDNEIDLPYYVLTQEEIKLVISKGKVYDERMRLWLDSFQGYLRSKMRRDLTEEERVLLAFFRKSEQHNRQERYTILLTADNNHANAIADLLERGLIFKNSASAEYYPIYQVDRQLMRSDFSDELQRIFGAVWQSLSNDYKSTLNAIYLHNHFNAEAVISANSIGVYLYFGDYQQTNDLKDYENKKRKIRRIFNELERGKFIQYKSENKKLGYEINAAFNKASNLFE